MPTPREDGLEHSNPIITPFHCTTLEKPGRYIGLEIEFEVLSRGNRSEVVDWFSESEFTLHFWMKSDGSLSESGGVELCSQPMTFLYWKRYGWAHLDKLLKNLEGMHCRAWDQIRSCAGIHVSFSYDWWDGNSHLMRTWKAIISCKDLIFTLSRRKNRNDLYRWGSPNPIDASDMEYFLRHVCQGEWENRYIALNTKNSDRGEFRIFRSTLLTDSIKSYVDVCRGLIEYSRKKSDYSEKELEKFLSGYRTIRKTYNL